MILAYLDPVYIVLFLCFSHSSTIYISRRDRFLKSRFCVSFIFVFQAPSTMHIVVLINIPQMTNSLTTFLEGRDLTCLLLWHAQWRLACVPFLISVNLFISKVFSSQSQTEVFYFEPQYFRVSLAAAAQIILLFENICGSSGPQN